MMVKPATASYLNPKETLRLDELDKLIKWYAREAANLRSERRRLLSTARTRAWNARREADG